MRYRVRIELSKNIPRVNVLAFVEIDFGDIPVHAAADGHSIKRLRRANAIEINGNIFCLHNTNDRGHR